MTNANTANLIELSNTRFIFYTNFEGNPDNDPRFRSSERRGNLVINDHDLALKMIADGFNVKHTEPRLQDDPDTFEPEYYIPVKLNFDSRRPPKVYLVSGNSEPLLLGANDMKTIDSLQKDHLIQAVNAVCNVYFNTARGSKTLYVQLMYVEKRVEYDPYAARYKSSGADVDGDLPF